MAQFKLDRFTYSYAGDWAKATPYKLDDIITINGNVYFCTKSHTSQSDFYLDFLYDFTYPAPYSASDNVNDSFNFNVDVGGENNTVDGTGIDFTVTRSGNQYTVTLVTGGRNYVQAETFLIPGDQLGGIRGTHDATVTIATVDNAEIDNVIVPGVVQSLTIEGTPSLTKWELISEGLSWRGAWKPSTGVPGEADYVPQEYYINDLVSKAGQIYKCVQGHTSTTDVAFGLENNIRYWSLLTKGSKWKGIWTGFTDYVPGDVVKYGGNTWRCELKHTSGTNAQGIDYNQGNWVAVSKSDKFENAWQTSTVYKVNDIVRYGGMVYRCTILHTSAASFTGDDSGLEFDINKWEVVVSGIDWKGLWQFNTKYIVGDLVRYSQNVYRCITTHTTPITDDSSLEDFNTLYWETYVTGLAAEGVWDTEEEYQPGDIVEYGGYAYYAKSFSSGAIPSETPSDWELVGQWYDFKGDWNSSEPYKVGQIVLNNGYMYWCTTDNQNQKPDSGVNTAIYSVRVNGDNKYVWNGDVTPDLTLLRGNTYTIDQTHSSNDSRPIYVATHVDGFNDSNGNGALLGKGVQVTYLLDEEAVNTAQDYNAGFNAASARRILVKIEPDCPDSIYFADFNNAGTNNTAVMTVTGSGYWDLLAPGVSYRGVWDDVAPDSSTTEYQLGDIVVWAGTSYECIKRHSSLTVGSRPDNDVKKDVPEYWVIFIQGIKTNALARKGDIKSFQADSNIRIPVGDTGTVLKALEQQIEDSTNVQGPQWELFNETSNVFFVSLDGIDAADRGKTQSNAFRTIKYALEHIENDKAQLAPATVKVGTGEFAEQLPLKVPADVAVVGHELRSTRIVPAVGFSDTDMFHVKNGCGIRNCTLKGLVGTLGDPNEFGTRRPTNGGPSFVSLDPGTGPSDSTVWVTNKSTYVQNVSTFGIGCVGMKIDGGLHGGGNKSIVANDFTQVISGGIGVWVTNGGKSELVSVFTYYNHIGYLSEVGGKIRATNGNNSYGDFGSVAEGYDLTETPITATVNNRSGEASIREILTDLDNEIYFLGYDHAGQNYSQAEITAFSGTGSGLKTEFLEYRNKALSTARILDPGDSSTAGGSGFIVIQGQAQSGDTTGLYLDQTTTIEDSAGVLDGKRIFIYQGQGKGQYGYIQSYDPSTFRCEVLKESDNTPGWDHFRVGTPILSSFDETAGYQIEPRITFQDPPYSQESLNLGTTLDYKKVVWGGDKFVAIAQSEFGSPTTNKFLYSSNGTSWAEGTFSGAGTPQNTGAWSWDDLIYGGGKWVAVAKQGIVAVSENGTTWTLQELGEDSTVTTKRQVRYGENEITRENILVTTSQYGDNKVFHFNNATNTAPDFVLNTESTYVFNQNDASNDGCPLYLSTNPDGIAGGGAAYVNSVKYFLDNVQVANLAAYVAGFDGANTRRVEFKVPEELVNTNFYYVNYNETGSNVQTDSTYARLIINGRREFIITGLGTTYYYQSLDLGVTWEQKILPSAESYNAGIASLEYGAGRFIGVTTDYDSSKTRMYVKRSGSANFDEEFISSADMSQFNDLVFGNNIFLATKSGSDSVFINNSYGLGEWYEWTGRLPSTGDWKLGYGQGVYYAFKPRSTELAISENGINWTAKSLPDARNWTSIGTGNPGGISQSLLVASGFPLQGSGEPNGMKIFAGRKPFARAKINNNRLDSVLIYDPGSNYSSDLTTEAINYKVTVGRNTEDTANVYYIDGAESPVLNMTEGKTYVFDQTDSSNELFGGVDGDANIHPIGFSSVGVDQSIGYQDNVIYNLDGIDKTYDGYLAGFEAAIERTITISIPFDAPSSLYYVCAYHANMGNVINISETNDLGIIITDPVAAQLPNIKLRLADGVLPQPSFISRGEKFRSATATIDGNGYADRYQLGADVVVSGLTRIPGPGANLSVSGIDYRQYLITKVTSTNTTDPEYNNGAVIDVTGDGSDFFKREVTVNGVRIMAAGTVGGQTAVPDAFTEKVARMVELFTDPDGSAINNAQQRTLIKTLSGDVGTYHVGKPTIQRVARGAGADYSPNFLTDAGILAWNLTDLYDATVQNDMVWYLNSTGGISGNGDNDAQEVIEHVFHTLHMHGLNASQLKLYPDFYSDWQTGDLYAAMEEADDGGYWDPSGYATNWKTDGGEFEVAAKEYLYLLNFCMFDYSDLWENDSLAPEWADSVKTPAGIQANLPLGYALHNTYIAPVISKPSLATIRTIFKDGDAGDPENAGASGYIVTVAGDGTTTLKISPPFGRDESPDHDTLFTIREQYSQVRLTFHDFLDLGTGNQNSTRYPIRYLEGFVEGADFATRPEQETDFSDGGRVFYSSTDQDGNFRVGELFEVEQASGIVTINADQFELGGLTEISLGGVTLGGTGAVIREFSIDSLFTANSNNIVPTQKAIAAYVKSRITGGGSSVNVNKVTAGVITTGDTGQALETTDDSVIEVTAKMTFNGGVDGSLAAWAFFGSGTHIPIVDDMGGTDETMELGDPGQYTGDPS